VLDLPSLVPHIPASLDICMFLNHLGYVTLLAIAVNGTSRFCGFIPERCCGGMSSVRDAETGFLPRDLLRVKTGRLSTLGIGRAE
jgi:hypothetical protein